MSADLQDPDLDKPSNGAMSLALALAAIAVVLLAAWFFLVG